ncbi:hypothetical protein R3P38DRAFT_3152551, partial [Favolaschia claudopus]
RVHDRLDRLEFGDTAASTPRGHAWRFSWDGARWGSEPSTPAPTPAIIAGLHQSHDISGAQLQAYTDKASPLERRVSIRGTDQQIGEALIALGKRFMRKRIRSKKKGPSRLSGDPAPPLLRPGAAAVLSRTQVPLHSQGSLGCDLHHRESSYPASHSLPHNPATISIPTQVMASPIPTPRPSSTPYAPSVAMPHCHPVPLSTFSSFFAYGH